MNVLYISFLSGNLWAGPTYSVPKQIQAQTKQDNVLWYNQIYGNKFGSEESIMEWKRCSYYCDFDNYPEARISELPAPFNSPDLVIVEQCYPFAKKKIMIDLLFGHYRYVVVPRGELTKGAQSLKRPKKIVANFLLYNRFLKNACAIQYLTKEESETSSSRWNKRSFIIPNGTNLPQEYKKDFCKNGISCVSIGRIAIYHKGIDLLLEACEKIRGLLISARCTIDIYGPDREGKKTELCNEIKKKELEKIVRIHDGVYGDDKEKVMMNSDVFFMTSRFEGHPTALLDAMAHGLPCLVTTGSNMRKEIEQGDAGWGADCTVDSIRNAIQIMVSDKDRYREKGYNSRVLASEYSWHSLAERCHKEYSALILEE